MVWQRTESAPLLAADDERLVVDSLQDPANRYFSAQGGEV
jgi:hypothetical protein